MIPAILLGALALSPALPAAPAASEAAASVVDWKAEVEAGKAKLAQGDAAGALRHFETAHTEAGTAASEIWLLRGRSATGGHDAAFERLAAIEAAGSAKGNDLVYAMGATRHDQAAAREAAGNGRAAGGMYQEAAVLLKRATGAAPDDYPDAWRMLAKAGLMSGDLEASAGAVRRALLAQSDLATLRLAGRILTAHGAALVGDEGTKKDGEKALREAVGHLGTAAKSLGDDSKNAADLCDLSMQAAVAQLYLGQRDEASSSYVTAIRWDPTKLDYGQMLTSLKGEDDSLYIETLGKGSKAFAKQWGEGQNADAGLHWWRGYAQHFAGQYDDSIASFETSIEKFPNYTSGLWYIGLSHWQKGVEHFPKAAEAWERYVVVNPREYAQTVQSVPTNAGYIGKAVQLLWKDGQPHLDNVQAARFAELLVAADRTRPEYWSSLGVMSRDAGFALAQRKPEDAPKSAEQLYERAWEA
ncbi:MAG: tetratricopeptide repeat protein, partial [Planctomycetota bacterium]